MFVNPIALVYRSRYTEGLKNGENVSFNKGETVKYKLQDGSILDIIIQSELRRHINGRCGYEAIFSDDNQLAFADWERIIDWQGKVA